MTSPLPSPLSFDSCCAPRGLTRARFTSLRDAAPRCQLRASARRLPALHGASEVPSAFPGPHRESATGLM
eukprot:12020041-Alexandrium_andersonii.AAC.1